MLERYPPKAADAPVARAGAPPSTPSSAPTAPATAPPMTRPLPTAPAPALPQGLISLDKGFDVDGFSQSLGETTLRVLVPREDLAEVLRRITDFMGFGIYVYSVRIYPEPAEVLKRFVVELQRVDFSSDRHEWAPFVEKGRSDDPFGENPRS